MLFSYSSKKAIERQIAALKSGESGFDQAASIKQTQALLPEDVDMVAYLGPRGAVAWVKRILTDLLSPNAMEKLPEFPATPTIGFAARRASAVLEAELVVPAELPQAIKEFVKNAQ